MIGLLWFLSWPLRFLLRRLPLRASAAIGRALGFVWYRFIPIRRGDVRRHVARAFPDWTQEAQESLVKASYLHLGQCFFELLVTVGRHGREIPHQVTGWEHMERALAMGRGVLVMSAHLGNFELLIRAARALNRPVSVVTKSFHSSTAQSLWRALRTNLPENIQFVPDQRSARQLCRCLNQGGVVAMVLDQHAPNHAEPALFFNHVAQSSTSLARLARLTRAPVVPIFTHRHGVAHIIEIGEIIQHSENLADDVQREQSVIERAIRRTPEQWLWLHRRWKPWTCHKIEETPLSMRSKLPEIP